MEELNFGHVLGGVVAITLLLDGILIPAVLGLISLWVEFVFRKKEDSLSLGRIWLMKYTYLYEEDEDILGMEVYWVFNALHTFVLLLTVGSLWFFTGNSLLIFGGAISLLTTVYLPRFIVDLCRSLKYNKDSGKLDTITKMQEEIDSLKRLKEGNK